jgi:putative flavoprotein involved in K+ transport
MEMVCPTRARLVTSIRMVVWATGYRSDYSWIHIPTATSDGRVGHRRGVTDVPGLYFLGLSW